MKRLFNTLAFSFLVLISTPTLAQEDASTEPVDQTADSITRFARAFNDNIARAREEGYSYSLQGYNLVTFLNVIGRNLFNFSPEYIQPFYDQVKNNEGDLLVYNLGGMFSYVLASAEADNDLMADHVHFIQETKLSEDMQNAVQAKPSSTVTEAEVKTQKETETKQEKIEKALIKAGLLQNVKLHEVKPEADLHKRGTELSAPDRDTGNGTEKSPAHPVIAATFDYVFQHPDTVYLLAFYGASKYQFFTLSQSAGYLNIAFAMDNKRPVPMVVASIPATSASDISTTDLANAVDYMMNRRSSHQERHRVPEFLGLYVVQGLSSDPVEQSLTGLKATNQRGRGAKFFNSQTEDSLLEAPAVYGYDSGDYETSEFRSNNEFFDNDNSGGDDYEQRGKPYADDAMTGFNDGNGSDEPDMGICGAGGEPAWCVK